MNVATQISDNIRPGHTTLRTFKSMLTFIGIRVTHPTKDGSLPYEMNSYTPWRQYDNELAFYGSIASSPFHIIYNDGATNEEIALQIAYAMLKNRPVIMTGTPSFEKDVSPFLHETVVKHLHNFHSVNLQKLELAELSLLLGTLKPTDYKLSKHEKVLIAAKVRAHFRDLLEETETLRIAKSESPLRPVEEN